MRHVALAFGWVVLLSGLAVVEQHNMPSEKMTDDEIIKSAMSAAPQAIGKTLQSSMSARTEKFELCAEAVTNLPAWRITPTRPVQTQCVPIETRWSGLTLG